MISSYNEIPYWPSYVASAVCSIILSVFFVKNLNMGIMGLVTAQLAVNSVYNFWKWPKYLMNKLGIKYSEIYIVGYTNIRRKLSGLRRS